MKTRNNESTRYVLGHQVWVLCLDHSGRCYAQVDLAVDARTCREKNKYILQRQIIKKKMLFVTAAD